MKRLFTLILICLSFCAGAQEKAYPDPFEFTLIDSVNASKEELFVRASEWMAKTFNSSKDVIQMSDKDAGKIVGKATMSVPMGKGLMAFSAIVEYTIAIAVKQGKYKVELSNFQDFGTSNGQSAHHGPLSESTPLVFGPTKKQWIALKVGTAGQSKSMVNEFKKSMHANTQASNW